MQVCKSIEAERQELGVAEFMTLSRVQGLSRNEAFSYYVNGKDVNGEMLTTGQHLDRGAALGKLQDCWLEK